MSAWYLCRECLYHPELLKFHDQVKKTSHKCVICGNTRDSIKLTANLALQNLTRSIVRFEYSEFEYNDEAGVIELLQNKGGILTNYPVPKIQGLYQKKKYFGRWTPMPIKEICGFNYAETEIPLFTKPEELPKLKYGYSLSRFSAEWTNLFDYFTQNNAGEFKKLLTTTLKPELKKLISITPKATRFYRARIGCNTKKVNKKHYIRDPYMDADIDMPPADKAKEGKFNQEKVSIFYGASTAETAIAETRPHPGHYVSVAEFQTLTEVSVLNLIELNLKDFCNNERELSIFSFLKQLQQFINTPIIPEERKLYGFTIELALLCSQLGLQGIKYQSSVAAGENIALFGQHTKYLIGSAKLYKIANLSYKTKQIFYLTDPVTQIQYEA